jgi:hypothetical protein
MRRGRQSLRARGQAQAGSVGFDFQSRENPGKAREPQDMVHMARASRYCAGGLSPIVAVPASCLLC